jgi:hypothetical protein
MDMYLLANCKKKIKKKHSAEESVEGVTEVKAHLARKKSTAHQVTNKLK